MKKIFLIACFGTLAALPQLPIVVEGEAAFNHLNEATLQITTTDRAIIDWTHFCLNENELTEFIQPSMNASVLNRVTSATPSVLLGRLSSNGQVILINPNGILVGKNGVVNTASFVASTLDLQNSVYLERGKLSFEGSGGLIQNEGLIASSGDVVLMGHSISQSGIIQAKNVALVAGKEGILSSGIEKIYIRSNLGRNDRNPFASAFICGNITAPGGDVILLGDEVKLQSATIDVSCKGGGGHIYVGGSYQGKEATLPGSLVTYVADDVLLNASAIESGNGGQVIVWSNGSTEFRGRIEAVGDRGGFAEVSGLKGLTYKGFADLHPFNSNGIFGTLLLDPSDILIDNAGVSTPAFTPPTYDPAVVMATLDITELNNALGSASILVQTNAGVGGNGDITLADTALTGISWSADTKLTLRAERNLIINNNIIAGAAYTGLGDQIELIADSGNTGTGDLIIYQTSANIDITTTDGPISLSGANIDMGNPSVTANLLVTSQGTRGSITMATPGLLRLQSPGAGFNGYAQLSSAQGQTINAGNWSIIGPGGGIGFPTNWISTGPVIAIVTGTTLVQAVDTGGGTESVFVDLQTLNLTTNDFSLIGGVNNNCNALLITAGDQTITVNNRMLVEAGEANTTHARLISGSTQTIQAANLEMYGGISGVFMAPNANAEIISNGNQIITVTGTTLMTPGDENGTNCLIIANSGDQTISSSSLTMLGGTSLANCESIISCSTGSQLITVNTLSMTGGTTPGQNAAGCRILAAVGPQTVIADLMNMTAGDQVNADALIQSAANQVIDCATNINLTGFLTTYPAALLATGDQTISALNINMTGETTIDADGLQTFDVANDFIMMGDPVFETVAKVEASNQQIANIGNDLIMMGNSSTPPSSSQWFCGDDSILNVGRNWSILGNGGNSNFTGSNNLSVDVGGNFIIDSTSGLNSVGFSCSDNLDMNIGVDFLIGSPISQSNQFFIAANTVAGGCTVRVGNNLTVTGGDFPNAQSSMNVRKNYLIAVGNDILFQGGGGASSTAYIGQEFYPNPDIRLLIAHNDITFRGGSGDQSFAYSFNYSDHQIRAGRDLVITGGVGLSAEAYVFGLTPEINTLINVGIQAGRDILISGGASASGGSFGYAEVFIGDLSLSAGRNILLTGGPLASNNHALIGTGWVDLSPFFMPAPDDISQTIIQAGGNFIAQNGPLGSIAYIDQIASGILEPTFLQTLFPPLVLSNNGSLTIQTVGDITLSSGYNASEAPAPFNTLIHDITIIADAPFGAGALWTGTADPFLVGTPLFSASPAIPANVFGGFSLDTGAVGGGFALTSVAGNIHLSSAEFFASGLLDNLVIGPVATLNNLTLTSITGNITVDPFHNITITNAVTTGGNVFMIAQNDISMTSTGLIAAGGSVELVCDNQAPVEPLVGPGAFLMDAGASITTGTVLRIFTARQSQNSILGLLNGLPFVASPLFTDTDQERWCVYYPEPILGTPFTIFYKECLGSILSEQVGPIISEFLVDLHSYGEFLPGWIANFSIADGHEDPFSSEYYFLRRRQIKSVNHPKTIMGL